MSFFGKVFGSGKKGEKAPTTGEAIQKLRETEDMLIKKQEFLEKKIEQVFIILCFISLTLLLCPGFCFYVSVSWSALQFFIDVLVKVAASGILYILDLPP